MLGRGSYTNTGYCPGTSRDANGYNRNFRYKEIFNVANMYCLRCIVLKLHEEIIKYTISMRLFMWIFFNQSSHCLSVGAFYICLQVFILIIKIRRYLNDKKVHFNLAEKIRNEVIKFFLCIISRVLGG